MISTPPFGLTAGRENVGLDVFTGVVGVLVLVFDSVSFGVAVAVCCARRVYLLGIKRKN